MDERQRNREELEKSIFGIEDALIRSSLKLITDGMKVESNFYDEIFNRLETVLRAVPFMRVGNRYETAMILHYIAAAMIAEESLLCVRQANAMSKLEEKEQDRIAYAVAKFLNEKQQQNVMRHHDYCYKTLIIPYIFEQGNQKDAKTD